jgi:hypothetical protein
MPAHNIVAGPVIMGYNCDKCGQPVVGIEDEPTQELEDGAPGFLSECTNEECKQQYKLEMKFPHTSFVPFDDWQRLILQVKQRKAASQIVVPNVVGSGRNGIK